MSRPHIEFIFSQALPWVRGSPLAGRRDVRWKQLSADANGVEVTGLLEFTEPWRGWVKNSFEEEIYVLAGEVTLDSQPLGRDGYGRLPAGSTHEWTARKGTALIIFVNESDMSGAAGAPTLIDSIALPWDIDGVPPQLDYMGIRRKALFVDSDTLNHRTWLLSTAPQNFPRGKQLDRETHGCAEELFMLSGEITGPHGIMWAGAYFWRPAQTLHGPYGSRHGSLALCRFRHGPQTTRFHDLRLPFSYHAPYRPVLPPELSHLNESQGPFFPPY